MDYKVKEPLKTENILYDIKHYCNREVYSASLITAVLVACMIGWCIVCFKNDVPFLKNVLELPVLLLILGLLIPSVIYLIRSISARINAPKKYSLETDKLVDIQKPFKPTRKYHLLFCFAKQGNFDSHSGSHYRIFGVDIGKFYPWSENHKMFIKGLERSSFVGEEFYIVKYRKKIINIYNKKIFELVDM